MVVWARPLLTAWCKRASSFQEAKIWVPTSSFFSYAVGVCHLILLRANHTQLALDDHRLLPGIEAGDIGPKAMGGYATTDNGYVKFDHVRIPKDHMLSRFAQVTDKGGYVKPVHDKIGYGGMVYIRSG